MALTGQLATVRRYATNRYGDRTEVLSFQVGGVVLAPRSTREATDRSSRVQADADLYAPFWADLRPQDVVEVDDTRWEVAGAPERWRGAWDDWQAGIVVPVNRG